MEEINIGIKGIIKLLIFIILFMIIASGCSIGQKANLDQNDSIETSSIISPYINVNEQYYRGVLPYKSSQINGLIKKIPSRLDSNYFELGLLELAKTIYDPSKYIFQEGQVLKISEIEKMFEQKQYSNFLYTVAEHDYLLEDGSFGGIVIGLVISPTYKVKNENGEYITEYYTDEDLKEQSKQLANDITFIIRRKIADSSILFGVMKTETNDLKKPGTFFLTGTVNENDNSIEWNDQNEVFIFLPTFSKIDDNYGEIAKIFNHFKEQLDQYLPKFAGVTGLVRFVEGDLLEINIKVYTEFNSTVEVIQFTQFAIALISEYFPEKVHVNMYINSIDRPRAIYVKKSNGDDFMHIYRN